MIRTILRSRKLMWLLQLIVMLLISLCATYLPLLLPSAATILRAVFLWILPLCFGAWSSCRLARSGMISHAAWLLPPIIHSMVPWILIGYPPTPGSMLILALVSLVGAATGDVLCRRERS